MTWSSAKLKKERKSDNGAKAEWLGTNDAGGIIGYRVYHWHKDAINQFDLLEDGDERARRLMTDEEYASYYPFATGNEFDAMVKFHLVRGGKNTDAWTKLWETADAFWAKQQKKDKDAYERYKRRRAFFLENYVRALWPNSDGSFVVHVYESQDPECASLAYSLISMRDDEMFTEEFRKHRLQYAEDYSAGWKTGEDVLASVEKQCALDKDVTFYDLKITEEEEED
jgi:hypothetical protein